MSLQGSDLRTEVTSGQSNMGDLEDTVEGEMRIVRRTTIVSSGKVAQV